MALLSAPFTTREPSLRPSSNSPRAGTTNMTTPTALQRVPSSSCFPAFLHSGPSPHWRIRESPLLFSYGLSACVYLSPLPRRPFTQLFNGPTGGCPQFKFFPGHLTCCMGLRSWNKSGIFSSDLDTVLFKKLEKVAPFMPLTKHANATVSYSVSCPQMGTVGNGTTSAHWGLMTH